MSKMMRAVVLCQSWIWFAVEIVKKRLAQSLPKLHFFQIQIGVIETEDGMLSPQFLANLSLPQIQLIVNDLLNQISGKQSLRVNAETRNI